MKIARAQVVVCSPGRNVVTLKLQTDNGLAGPGDATLYGRGPCRGQLPGGA